LSSSVASDVETSPGYPEKPSLGYVARATSGYRMLIV
jgi:hypothetical protein